MANPRIITSISLQNTDADMQFRQSNSTTANEPSCFTEVVTLTTSSTTVDDGTVLNPKYASFANLSESGSILVGFDGVNYDMEVQPGDMMQLRFRDSDKLETQTVQTVADSSGSLNTTYFTLEGESGTWAVWFDIDNSGSAEPAHGQTNSVKIFGVVTDDPAANVASVMATELTDDAAFSGDFDVAYDATSDNDLVTITDKFTGNRTDIAAGTSGFTVATTQDGGTKRVVYAKAAAGEISALVAIMPK